MTTGTSTNYGSVFHMPSGTAYLCQVIDYPELVMEAVDITNHAGGGATEYIPNGLLDAGVFTLSVLAQSGKLSSMKTAMAAKTVSVCMLASPIATMLFSGMVTNIKPEAADATNPDADKYTVTVRPTGPITIT